MCVFFDREIFSLSLYNIFLSNKTKTDNKITKQQIDNKIQYKTTKNMSTYALHHSALERRRVMLKKLGGEDKRREAIDRFYQKQMEDERILHFFDGIDVEIIKWHQFNLMSIAFTAVPATFDVQKLLLVRHQPLFDQGLNEHHFDIVAHHFTSTLQEMGCDPELSKEALEVVMPLRDVFQEGAAQAKARKKRAQFQWQLEKGMMVAIVAAFVLHHWRGKKN